MERFIRNTNRFLNKFLKVFMIASFTLIAALLLTGGILEIDMLAIVLGIVFAVLTYLVITKWDIAKMEKAEEEWVERQTKKLEEWGEKQVEKIEKWEIDKGLKNPEQDLTVAQEELAKANFIIDKHLVLFHSQFFVDDKARKFAVYLEEELLIFHYHDLLDYKMQENEGVSISFGHGSSTCHSLLVRLKVNDLHRPQIVIPFIKLPVGKDSGEYMKRLEEAETLMSVLAYIENKNKEEPSKIS